MDAEDFDVKQRILKAHRRRLAKLQERKALLGYDSDPKIDLEIEDIEQEINRLDGEIYQNECKDRTAHYVSEQAITTPSIFPVPRVMLLVLAILSLLFLFYRVRLDSDVGKIWKLDGLTLKLVQSSFSEHPQVVWSITNDTSKSIQLPQSFYERFYAQDNFGQYIMVEIINCENFTNQTIDCYSILDPGQSITFVQRLTFLKSQENRTKVVITTYNIDQTLSAQWNIPIR